LDEQPPTVSVGFQQLPLLQGAIAVTAPTGVPLQFPCPLHWSFVVLSCPSSQVVPAGEKVGVHPLPLTVDALSHGPGVQV
jgi:hypothetical protein